MFIDVVILTTLKVQKMKKTLFFIAIALMITSCASIRVSSDYDTKTDFSKYKTFAFYKKGIDKAPISSLDKRRILRAVEAELLAKGFVKSENPDILVSIFTKSRKNVRVHNDYPFYGWRPWYYGANWGTQISQHTEGTLFVDLIDAHKKELVWQGIGSGALVTSGNVKSKEQKIKEFVMQIMKEYPPKK